MEWNTSPKNKDKSTKQSKNLTREGRRNKRRINECLRSHTHALFGGLRSSYDHLCVTDFSQRDCLFCSLVGDVAWNGGGPSPSFHTARGVSWSWPHAIACSAPSHLPGALAPAEKLPSLRVGRSFFPGGGEEKREGIQSRGVFFLPVCGHAHLLKKLHPPKALSSCSIQGCRGGLSI